MKISAKAEYACLAVFELAVRSGRQEPIRLAEIAQPNGIPERFLVQILLQLKGPGLVTSLRGAAGGYKLAVNPAAISLWDVVHTIEGPTAESIAQNTINTGLGWEVLREVWMEVNRHEQEYLKQTNYADLVERAKQRDTSSMYYI